MDTKWKKISNNRLVKGLTLALTVLLLSTSVLMFQLGSMKNMNYESIFVKNYLNSKAYEEDVLSIIKQVVNVTYSDMNMEDVDYIYSIRYANGEFAYSNTVQSGEEYFAENFPIYLSLNNGVWINQTTGARIPYNGYIRLYYEGYIGLTETYLYGKQEAWVQAREVLLPYFISCTSLALFGILLVIYLLVVSGRHQKDGKLQISRWDKVYTEIILFLTGGVIYLYLFILQDLFYDDGVIGLRIRRECIHINTDFQHRPLASAIFSMIIVASFFTFLIVLILSLLRRLRSGYFIKQSALYKIIKKSVRVTTDIYRYLFYGDLFQDAPMTKKLYYRQLVMIIGSVFMFGLAIFFAAMETGFFLIPLILAIIIMYWFASGNNRLYQDIDSNLEVSINDRLKAERTKVALITNVSHDLKTPLTSIISYVELLSKEEGLSETSADYIRILQSKSERLKNIVTDLFELAKSTSGDVTLNYEEIDLKRLIEQTLAEMDDKISVSGLVIKINLPDNQVNIKTDGKRLYRVFQNVIDNALKYSLMGTRIYIDLTKELGKATVTIKNTANYEMNFTAEEILQRFVRGDQARTEDGSGLGLSIAESFTKVCGGEFKVDIDGDMFKVRIIFQSEE